MTLPCVPTTPPAGEVPGLFVRDKDRFVPTIFAQGPWAPDLQFGGSAAALLTSVVDAVPTLVPQRIARLTVDLMRPVPLRPVTVPHRVVREGKRIQVVEASIVADGIEVARCTALRLRTADLGDDLALPAGPPQLGPPDGPPTPFPRMRPDELPGNARAVEFRASGGPAMQVPTWIRLLIPVIAGEEVSPLAPLAFIADFASGVGHPRVGGLSAINADLSIHVVRYPDGEWLCLTGTGWTSRHGIGHSQAQLSDDRGVLATAMLSRLVDRLPEA